MTSNLTCEALRDDILALLYEDGELAERTRARDHLAQCVPCRVEYGEFKSVRKALSGWTLPAEPPVVSSIPTVRRTARWMTAGFAAAAGLILGVGLAVAGRSLFQPNAASPANPAVAAATSASVPRSEATATTPVSTSLVSRDEFQEALRAQEARHQTELSELRQALLQGSDVNGSSGAARAAAASNLSPAAFERLLRASEERQARLIEARLSGLKTETDLQRQYDMAQIAAGLAYIDSRTGADAARTSELMKNLVRVTAKPQDR